MIKNYPCCKTKVRNKIEFPLSKLIFSNLNILKSLKCSQLFSYYALNKFSKRMEGVILEYTTFFLTKEKVIRNFKISFSSIAYHYNCISLIVTLTLPLLNSGLPVEAWKANNRFGWKWNLTQDRQLRLCMEKKLSSNSSTATLTSFTLSMESYYLPIWQF